MFINSKRGGSGGSVRGLTRNRRYKKAWSELFGVMVVNKKQQVMILGSTLELDLQWADGMVGCMPVFGSREAAEKYAGSRRIDIVSLSIGDE